MALFVDVDNTSIPAKQTQSQVMDHAYEKDDQLVLSFPVSFVSVDLNIQFGSFGLSNEGNSMQELSNADAKPEGGSDVKSHEPVLIDLQENMSCEGVDDINDGQTIPSFEDEKPNEQVKNDRISLEEISTMLVYDHAITVKEVSHKDAETDISSHEPILIDLQENASCEGVDHGQIVPRSEEENLHEQDDQILVKRVESFMDTDEEFWEDCILFHVIPHEIEVVQEELKFVSRVTNSVTEKIVKVVQEEDSYDQNKADLFEEFGHVLENETDIEEKKDMLKEVILLEKHVKENEAHERNKGYDEKAQTLAEIQAVKKDRLREKRRIKRLRKKDKQRAGKDATESSKAKRAWGSMVITVMVVALSVLSLTNADLSMLLSSHH